MRAWHPTLPKGSVHLVPRLPLHTSGNASDPCWIRLWLYVPLLPCSAALSAACFRGTPQCENTNWKLTDTRSRAMRSMRSKTRLSIASSTAAGPAFNAIGSDSESVNATTRVLCVLLSSMTSTSLFKPASIATHSARQLQASEPAPSSTIPRRLPFGHTSAPAPDETSSTTDPSVHS
ncbi:hypothetical protein TRVL_09362 [Trypanosoma vivax]|nr:hypothetical protein TRVL_09362 [Trypanosoma vivax]